MGKRKQGEAEITSGVELPPHEVSQYVVRAVELADADAKILHHLQDRLEHCCERLLEIKEENAQANRVFNEDIRGVEEEIGGILIEIRSTRFKSDGLQPPLPLTGPVSPNHRAASEGNAPSQAPPTTPKDRDSPDSCLSCGHRWEAAHYSDRGEARPCAVFGCSCLASVTLDGMAQEAKAHEGG